MNIDLSNKKVWQIANGDSSRDYSSVFLDFGVALVGPGNFGDAREPKSYECYKSKENKDANKVLIFKEIKKDDWLILKNGQMEVIAVGKVSSNYDYNPIFADVDGWDLHHFVNVDWYIPSNDKIISLSKRYLSRTTVAACRKKEVFDVINTIDFKLEIKKHDYLSLSVPKAISFDDISEFLINKGIRIKDSEDISNTIMRIQKLAKWYLEHDSSTLEHEIRTFLVIPLLISLGWSEQKIKIEYNKIDIAIFNNSFDGNYKSSPNIIIETKTFADGLSYTHKQAQVYAKKYPECNTLITTNGIMYKIYKKHNSEFRQHAYLNISNLREKNYLYSDMGGAMDALIHMSDLA